MKYSNRQIRRFHAYVTNKCTPCKPTWCIPLHHFRKILVNCLKENLKTLVHMIVFLKHDQLIQTEGLIENFTHALNFAKCHVESRQCQTLYDICTYPIMHLIPLLPHPPPHPAQICITFVFSFPLGITAVPREIENNASAKFWGQKREVHYGWCASGEFECRYVQTLG